MASASPRVSVVITSYNYGRYLAMAIDSALGQTYGNTEVIVVDDGSTDNTDMVMQPYLSDRRVVYLRQSNSGQAVAKNVGIRRTQGEFIAFLDADDIWAPTKVEKQLQLFDNPRIGVVYTRARYLDPNNHTFDYEMTGRYLQPRRGDVTEWLIFDNFVQFSSSMVRAECLKRCGLFDETLKMGIDWDLWLRISTVYLFDYVDEQLFYYRMGHSGQMSKNLEERQRCSDRIIKRFLAEHFGMVPLRKVRAAQAYTYCTRGGYFLDIGDGRSLGFFLQAIKVAPTRIDGYKGIVKCLLRPRHDTRPRIAGIMKTIMSDLHRYCGKGGISSFVSCFLSVPGFRYSVFMRSAKFFKQKGALFLPLYLLSRLALNHYQYKYGISIPYNTDIGPGLYIGHFGGIVVNSEAKIGANCNINQDVTIGVTYGGKYPGTPVVMNNVYLGPGSRVIGGITLGNHAAVGANCVVTKPVPDHGVVVGIPGEVVSSKGSSEYVVNTIDGAGS